MLMGLAPLAGMMRDSGPVTLINRSSLRNSSSSTGSDHTWTAVPIGTASSTRRVIVGVTANEFYLDAQTIVSATIGGVAATIDVQTVTTSRTRISAVISAALQSNWLTAHVVTCFFGYAAFAMSFAISIMYLFRSGSERKAGKGAEGLLPPTRVLDDLSYKSVAVGFPLLTLGILTGAAWANYAWGTYWSWDPTETWSLITWFVYAAFLHARFTAGWKGTRLAWLSIVGFGAVIFTYWGVNFILSGLHSYAG